MDLSSSICRVTASKRLAAWRRKITPNRPNEHFLSLDVLRRFLDRLAPMGKKVLLDSTTYHILWSGHRDSQEAGPT